MKSTGRKPSSSDSLFIGDAVTNTPFWTQYQPPHVAESAPTRPTEAELQALWFEQWLPEELQTDDGRRIQIIQPGNWNHDAGPDFLQAAVRLPDGELRVGTVELHLRAADWEAHGHHLDPAYNDTVLHVVWETSGREFFPATENFRHVPQIILRPQLAIPWDELHPQLAALVSQHPLPTAKTGRCQKAFATQNPNALLNFLRAAGAFRLHRKAQRLSWKIQAVGKRQTLWETLVEGLGYSGNKIPFRTLAQRLPLTMLLKLPHEERLARIFGFSGLLPATNLSAFAPDVREWIRPQWDRWWKIRTRYDYAILPRSAWKLSGLRPWNRPERRLAAMATLTPRVSRLLDAIESGDASSFQQQLETLSDPFWEQHTTFTAGPLSKPHHLLGAERIDDLLINVFWPLVSLRHEKAALRGWHAMESASNAKAELARQRIVGNLLPAIALRETLVQQGLLQLLQDYCETDASDCASCPFANRVDNQ